MYSSLPQILICLLLGITLIVLLTAKYKVHAFFALLLACFVVGLGVQMPVADIIIAIKEGFGNIMKSLALIIILGTTLGILLEYTGSTRVMAETILKLIGQARAPLAMSLTGFIVGLPIFCDSGYIVLSGLNNSLAARTHIPNAIMAVCLATGLYSVHCLIPPHPGASAAAGIIGVDVGLLILSGIIIAIPVMIVGYIWATYAGKKFPGVITYAHSYQIENNNRPSVTGSFIPVIVPIISIALKAFIKPEALTHSLFVKNFIVLGDPVIALLIGVMLAFNCGKNWHKESVSRLLQEGAEKGGGILVIIGAGGAFGAVLAATKIGEQVSAALPLAQLGILFPFLITFVLKTAQGSSTVAIITASSIVLPLLPALGLHNNNGHLLTVLSMGAGSLMISHSNDAYFWVISKFSGLDIRTMLKVYSVATLLMGITAFTLVYVLSLIIK